MKNKRLLGIVSLIAAFLLLVAVNAISQPLLRGARVDLTENKLYTLSEGTENILRNLEDPITLRFYYSEKSLANVPFIRAYGDFVKEKLQSYAEKSNGRIILEIIDPIPFSEAEDQAVAAGMEPLPLTATEVAYFGLEGANEVDERQIIPAFNPSGQEFLEYEISSLVYNLSQTSKRRIVIMSSLPIQGSGNDPMARFSGQQVPPWIIYSSLNRLYNVEVHDFTLSDVPEGDIDLLILIHPKRLTENLEYSIDQYVMNGGKTLVFIDPMAETDDSGNVPGNPLQSMVAPKDSSLPRLLSVLGLESPVGEIAADRKNSIQIPINEGGRPELINFVAYISLTADDINSTDVVTSRMDRLQLGTPGWLKKLDGATTTVTPLFETSADSSIVTTDRLQMMQIDSRVVRELLREFESDDEKKMIAARVSGRTKSFFGDAPPGDILNPNHLSESKGEVNAIVVADTDMLTDRFWVNRHPLFGVTPTANNGDFFINAVDVLSGSDDLISIRSRGRFDRSFKVIEEKLQVARERFAEREREFQERLDTVNAELNQLLEAGDSNTFWTPEVQDRIDALRQEQADTRRALRQTNLELRQDVERLQRNVKLVNIALIPALVGLIAIIVGAVRISNRRRR